MFAGRSKQLVTSGPSVPPPAPPDPPIDVPPIPDPVDEAVVAAELDVVPDALLLEAWAALVCVAPL